jgi:hypothetical protein
MLPGRQHPANNRLDPQHPLKALHLLDITHDLQAFLQIPNIPRNNNPTKSLNLREEGKHQIKKAKEKFMIFYGLNKMENQYL